MTQDLKKYCIEQALALNAGLDTVKIAREMYDFMRDGEALVPAAPVAVQRPTVKHWSAPPLTDIQRHVLKVCIERHSDGEKIDGSELGRVTKRTQSNMSLHLKNLVRKGYVRREGNKHWPVRDAKGNELPPVLTKYPPAPAIGYKPMTAKMGTIARFKI